MSNSAISNLNSSPNDKNWKQIWQLGNKHLVVIDESIIQKLGINDNLTTFVEQELTDEGILMRIRRFN
ncbi:MAG TPA: hypothetical protein VLA74_14000 [Nitrososphaeraceae archaeon]|nr:hypothetical protein [Nitrososphaeraceae archaeon]